MKAKKQQKVIMKFGGTSVGTPESIKKLIEIVTTSKENIVGLVISAFSKVTVQLVEAAELASKGDERYELLLQQVIKRHIEAVPVLIKDEKIQKETLVYVESMLSELKSIMQGVYLIKDASPKIMDTIMSYGELLSAPIITACFKDIGVDAEFIDARKLVKTDNTFGGATANLELSYKNIREEFKKTKALKIITGFIASTEKNETTILGRNGSDYSGALFGAAIGASKVEIWTDVDGVLTADPRKVPTAFTVPHMTYQEALEMTHFGAKVLYPQTILPAYSHNIPLVIRNTFHPEFPGTVIDGTASSQYPIKGISSFDDVSIILVQGSGIRATRGITAKLFTALSVNYVRIIMITQASSEYTICFAVQTKFAQKAKTVIENEFKHEMRDGLIDAPIVEENRSIITIIGEMMRKSVGIAGTLFMTLAEAKISVVAIAQGSSERNISFVIDAKDETKALNAIHKAFFNK